MAKARGEVEIVGCEGNRRGGGARGGDGHAISAGIVIGNCVTLRRGLVTDFCDLLEFFSFGVFIICSFIFVCEILI